MRESNIRVEAPASNSSGAAVRTARMRDVQVQVWGTFTATVTVEYRVHPDASTWLTAGSALTAPGVVSVPNAAYETRCTTSGFSSGAPLAALGGMMMG